MNNQKMQLLAAIAAVLTLAIAPAFAGDLNVDGNLNVASNSVVNGKLGVGTSNPTQKLDVAGAIAVNGTTVINSSGQFVGPQGPTVSTIAVCTYDPSNTQTCSNLCVGGRVIAQTRASFYTETDVGFIRIRQSGGCNVVAGGGSCYAAAAAAAGGAGGTPVVLVGPGTAFNLCCVCAVQ